MMKPNHRSWVLTSLGAAGIAGLVFACSSGGNNGSLTNYVPPPSTSSDGGTASTSDTPPTPLANDAGTAATYPFEAVAPVVYVSKVKNLILGLAATDDEVATVTKDPTQFRSMVANWLTQPQWQGKAISFFRNAFQQNHVTLNQLEANTNFPLDNWINNNYQGVFVQTLQDSFARTAWALASSGAPFNQTITSSTYMMTTAQLVLYAYLDELQQADTGTTTNRLVARNAIPKFTLDPNSTATIADTLNPQSPNYMIWHYPVPIPQGCTSTPPVVYDSTSDAGNNNQVQNYNTLFTLIFGGGLQYLPCYPEQNNNVPTVQAPPLLQDSDFSDWHQVTFNHITKTDTTSPAFYDLPGLRSASTVNLHKYRAGFEGTLAFEANWGTNPTNESRVITNQSLIVSITQSIDGENTVSVFPENTVDSDHASNPACTGCHSQLDPIHQYFTHTQTLFYSDQLDPSSLATQAAFGIDGVSATGTFLSDLFPTLATHPRYPLAWAGKLAFWATSVQAEETDPELIRISNAYAASNFNFQTLALEVFNSPLVTFAAPTQTTTDNGVLNTLSRADHWCAALSNRLSLNDVCGLDTPSPTQAQQNIASHVTLLPIDAYFRTYNYASLATNPDLVFRDAVEVICEAIANEVVDDNTDAGPSRYSSMNPTAAIADMVSNVMGLTPSDSRTAQATQILTSHFTAAKALQAANVDALKSTFTLACTSPPSVLQGL